MSAPVELRKRQLWIAEQQARDTWSFQAAILWIAYRDLEVMADWLMPGGNKRDALVGLGPLAASEVIEAAASADGRAVELLPYASLRVALMAGAVVANGRFYGSHGYASAVDQDGWKVTAEGWKEGLLLDHAPGLTPPILAPKGWRPRAMNTVPGPGRFSNVGIERDTLLAAFPAERDALLEALPAGSEAWRPGRLEKLTAWVRRPEVESGLRAALAAQGNRHPTGPDMRAQAHRVWNSDRPDAPRKLRSFERYFS